MATPARKLIMDNLQTTFAGVTAAAGYKTTVVTVQSLARGYFDVSTAEKPFIGYVPMVETVQHQPGDKYVDHWPYIWRDVIRSPG